MLRKLIKKFSLTEAIVWTLLNHLIRCLVGPVSMMLLVRYLTPEEQGFSYTFASVIGISIFLEMGFSQNILQFASHEFANLSLNSKNQLIGDGRSYSRFVSLARLSFKYYGIAALLFFLVLHFGGTWFFSTSQTHNVQWNGPWLLVSISAAASLLTNPCWSLLEGCNKYAEIAKFRCLSTLFGFGILSVGYWLGWGLYAACISSIAVLLASIIYLTSIWRHFFTAFLHRPKGEVISWKNEIWPFQWRIAISWMSGYFIFSIITPISFRIIGPVEAGKIGFTLQLTKLISTIASSWSTTRLAEFSMLVAKKNWLELGSIWKKATKINIGLCCLGSILLLGSMEMISKYIPEISNRYSGFSISLLFCITMILQAVIISLAYYLRAFKKDPFMILSIAYAVISFFSIMSSTYFFSAHGAAIAYLISTFVIIPFAINIFKKRYIIA